MKKQWSPWLRWPLILAVSAVVGWAATSAVVPRRISAVWQHVPTRRVSMYPSSLGRGVEARVSRITKGESLNEFTAWLAELAAEISPDRLRAALDAIRGLPEAWRMLAVETALARLAEIDPRAALDHALLRLGDGSAAWNALENILRSKAAEDPDALWQFLPAAARQLTRGQGLGGAIAMLNPDEGLAFIQRWHLPPDHPGVQECVLRAVSKIAKSDPARALSAVEPWAVDVHIAKSDPARALSASGQWSHADADEERWVPRIEDIVQTWAAASPEAAIQWIHQHSGNPDDPFASVTRNGFLEGMIMGLISRSDPQRAVDWFSSPPSDFDRWRSAGWIALRKENPEAAWRVLTTVVPPDQQAGAAMLRGSESWDGSGSEAKANIAWVGSWPPEWRTSTPPIGGADATLRDDDLHQWLALGAKLSPAAEARVAEQVERDPVAATVEFRNATPAAQRSALPGVIAGLVNTDPTQAAALLQELPRGEAWAAATVQLANEWSRFDRPAADAWMNTLPPATAQRVRAQLAKTGMSAR